MRLYVLTLITIAVVSLGLVGCAMFTPTPADPAGRPVTTVRDAEGLPVVDIATNPDGSTEDVPGSRDRYQTGGSIDKNIAALITLAGLAIPGAGYLGRRWGAIKPTQRFLGLGNSLQRIRTAVEDRDFNSPDHTGLTLKDVDGLLTTANAEVVGLSEAVRAAKNAGKIR